MTKDNRELGKFELSGIPSAPRGVPKIQVTFELDADGILHVSAKDEGTSKTETITIKNDKGRLSPEEIERMVKEAEQFADEDKKLKDRVDAKNNLETFAHSLKTQLDDKKIEGKITAEEKKTCLDAAAETISWIEKNTTAEKEEFDKKKEELEKIIHPIMSKLYPQGSQPGQPGQQGEQPSGNGEEIPKHDEL